MFSSGIRHSFQNHYPPVETGKSVWVKILKKRIKKRIDNTPSRGTVNPRRCTKDRVVFEARFNRVTGVDASGVHCYGIRVVTT